MLIWLIEAGAYAALGLLVLALCWHRKQTRVVAGFLLGYSLLSSATFFFHWSLEWRIVREAILIDGIATTMFLMLTRRDGGRCYKIGIAICGVDLAMCAALAMHGSGDPTMRALFGWSVNLTYIALCACVGWMGAKDVYARWIAGIARQRGADSSAPEFDWALRQLDR